MKYDLDSLREMDYSSLRGLCDGSGTVDTVGQCVLVFDEEAFIDGRLKDGLHWHTPGVIDGGIDVSCEPSGDNVTIIAYKDGIVELGRRQYSVPVEKYRHRIYMVEVDDDCGAIISYLDDPALSVYAVDFFDYTLNREKVVFVSARGEDEARIIAWKMSCYCGKDIEPGAYGVTLYDDAYVSGRAVSGVTDDVMSRQMSICEKHRADVSK